MTAPSAGSPDPAPSPGALTTPVRLDGDVAVVTGAGHGLGRAYALALAERGAAVVCNDVVADAAVATAAAITERGGRAVAQTDSVATAAGGAAIVATAVAAFGSLEIVVNNAGQLRNAPFEDLTLDDVEAIIATHLAGAFHVTQPAFRRMQAAGYGRIVFTSSAAGMFGSPWQSAYAAAKAGIVGLGHCVALEGAAHGIRANTIMPMALTGISQGERPPLSPEDLVELTALMGPLAPVLTPDHVAPLVVFLASRRCTLTGEVLSAGCGRFARAFVGLSDGWLAPGTAPTTPEAILEHLGSVLDDSAFSIPGSMHDEMRDLARRRGTSTP